MDDRLQRAPIGVLEVTTSGIVEGVNDVGRELIDADTDPSGVPIEEAFPRSVENPLGNAFEGDGVTLVEFEEYYPALDAWLSVSVVPTDAGVTVYVRDVTARRRHEQTVERLRDERERIAVIDELLSDVLAELVGASSREEIAETICTELGETDLYEFAWVGERTVDGDDLVVRAAAGETGETFPAVREALVDADTTPEERAVETGQLQVVQPLADDHRAPEPVRMAGFADGVQSLVAIPLVYGSNVYGVVGVYAAGEDAFSDRECASFETLGEVAGFAVTAARNRNLLFSDTVTEVTFDVGSDGVMSSLSQEIDAKLALQGLVPHGNDALLCYVRVRGDEIDELNDVVADVEGVGESRIISESDRQKTVELEIRDSSPLLTVSSLGGTVRDASFDSGSGRIVVELPPDEDVRRMANAVGQAFDAEVVAKRERERSASTARELHDDLDTRLTDRQETVLRTAYLADYFESPRGSTAEEVAGSLDITGSTLLHHLRAGQRKLLDVYFSDDAVRGE